MIRPQQVIDAIVVAARSKAMVLVRESEQRFIVSVTERGALTVAQAEEVVHEQREEVMEQLEVFLRDIRAQLERGGAASSIN